MRIRLLPSKIVEKALQAAQSAGSGPQSAGTDPAQECARSQFAAGQTGRLLLAGRVDQRIVYRRRGFRGRFGQAGPGPPFSGDSAAAG